MPRLLASLTGDGKEQFAKIEQQLSASAPAQGQARLVVQQHLLDWLVANTDRANGDSRMVGKLNALKYALQWKLPERVGQPEFKYGEEFNLDRQIASLLESPSFAQDGAHVESVTTNIGQAYIDECIANGVPIPPTIRHTRSGRHMGWKTQGFIPESQQFIGQESGPSPAEVRTFQSASPPGMCIALPRYTNTSRTTVKLDGVICLGQVTSKVCFWDNQMNRVTFPFPSGSVIPIGVPSVPGGEYQAGGAELEGGAGGVCTDCHAGQESLHRPPEI